MEFLGHPAYIYIYTKAYFVLGSGLSFALQPEIFGGTIFVSKDCLEKVVEELLHLRARIPCFDDCIGDPAHESR